MMYVPPRLILTPRKLGNYPFMGLDIEAQRLRDLHKVMQLMKHKTGTLTQTLPP